MTFADQWANRHDGECENEEIRGINFMIIGYRCHCYRRWLEARLERFSQESLAKILNDWMERQREGWTQHHCQHGTTCAESFNVKGIDEIDLDALLAALLPPKGAGDE